MSFSAPALIGWRVTVNRINSLSSFIQWANLSSLLRHRILYYIVILNRYCKGQPAVHDVLHGNILKTEIVQPYNERNCGAEVFGVDKLGQPYRTIQGIALGESSKRGKCR